MPSGKLEFVFIVVPRQYRNFSVSIRHRSSVGWRETRVHRNRGRQMLGSLTSRHECIEFVSGTLLVAGRADTSALSKFATGTILGILEVSTRVHWIRDQHFGSWPAQHQGIEFVFFTIISSPTFRFSGLLIIFYKYFFSNLPILRTLQYLLQVFPPKSSNSPDFQYLL